VEARHGRGLEARVPVADAESAPQCGMPRLQTSNPCTRRAPTCHVALCAGAEGRKPLLHALVNPFRALRAEASQWECSGAAGWVSGLLHEH